MRHPSLLAATLALGLAAATATAQIELTRSTFGAATGVTTSGVLELSSTLAQDTSGRISTGTLILDAGFWIPAGPVTPACPAEFNGDGSLNADDLGDFITCFFGTPPCDLADFNHDNDVNADDLGDFITAFFTGC